MKNDKFFDAIAGTAEAMIVTSAVTNNTYLKTFEVAGIDIQEFKDRTHQLQEVHYRLVVQMLSVCAQHIDMSGEEFDERMKKIIASTDEFMMGKKRDLSEIFEGKRIHH